MDDLSNLNVMFIEPSANVRLTFHNIFTGCGITRISHVLKASTAIPLLQKEHYDIILCEFDLSEGQNGQQLLEDLRKHRILPLTTLFLMVTGESSQDKVISTLELSPTEYLLKPFTTSSLLERVGRALTKRTAFMPTYTAMEIDDLDLAIQCCERGEISSPRHALDFRFLRAQLHLQQRHLKEAESLYDELTLSKNAQWAHLGLAKTWFLQNRLADAETALNALLQENSKLWEAYDCLADVMEADGRVEEAKQVLKSAVALSPHTVHRLRKLGRIALETGDTDTALEAFQSVVNKVRLSQFRDPEDYVHLVQALLGKDNAVQATSLIHELDKSLGNVRKIEACGALSSALVHEFKNEQESAVEKLATVVDACDHHDAGLSSDVKVLLAQSCLNNGMREEAKKVMLDVLSNIADDGTMKKMAATLERTGLKELSESVVQQSRQQTSELLATCEAKLRQGDYRGAVELMSQAAPKMPDNPEVAFTTASAMLTCIANTGWDDDLGTQMHYYINNVRRLHPAHPGLQELTDEHRAVLKKYNIPFERTSKRSRARL